MRLVASLVPAVVLLTTSLPAQDLIAVSWSGTAWAIDSLTGTASVIGPTGLFGHNALAFDGNGRLWHTERTGAAAAQWQYHLDLMNPVTGASAQIYNNTGLDLRGLAGDGTGVLWAVRDVSGPDSLGRIDPATGTWTAIGATGRSSIQALSWHQNRLLAWDLGIGLVTLDPTTGAHTDVNAAVTGTVPVGSIQFLCWHPDGRLLGGQDALYSIDTATGVATQIGAGFGSIDLRGAEPRWMQPFGKGCPSQFGPVALQVTGTPAQNQTIVSSSRPHAAPALGWLIVGFSNTSHLGFPLPFDLTQLLNLPGCFAYVSHDLTAPALTPAPAPSTLAFALFLPPSTVGLRFHLQHAVLESATLMSWSNAVTVLVSP